MSKNNLGRSLVKAHKKKKSFGKEGFRHTCDLPDGLDWARLNLRSITEQNSIDDFLGQAELAESEYSKEVANVRIVSPNENVLTNKIKKLMDDAQELHKHVLCVPRRPQWCESTTKEELDAMERNEFLSWRRKLAQLSEEEYVNLTPYEKNLEVWRQLWRVVERSDVVIQILDARNPLLFRCKDLETYVKEVGAKKNVLLLNKADFLSEEQRTYWAQYFTNIGIRVVFFSALWQNQKLCKLNEDDESEYFDESLNIAPERMAEIEEKEILDSHKNNTKSNLISTSPHEKSPPLISKNQDALLNDSKVLSREELISFFKQFRKIKGENDYVTIGLVGYPNVGKSSTINAIMLNKKVQVSATPGKTKHFQTLMVDPGLCLCDCPGLVFPNFVSSKAEMIINGILPIDHLTDHVAPMSLIVNLIPKATLETIYSIIIQLQSEKEDITAENFLDAYGYTRGFISQRGLPDHARSARYILKDFVNGKLLYCYPPPGVNEEDYQKYTIRPTKKITISQNPKMSKLKTCSEELDKNFFQTKISQVHIKGHKSPISSMQESGKPWKKHHNRNKKEKLRRIYNASDN